MAGFVVEELQADELRSFVGGKTRPTWIFVAIEGWSRLWPSPPSLISKHRRVRRAALVADHPDRGRASGRLSNSYRGSTGERAWEAFVLLILFPNHGSQARRFDDADDRL